MVQGLQAWNGSGQMVADIGDYSMRYAATVNFNATAGTTTWWVPFGGMRANGWIAVQVGLYYRTYSCIPSTDGFTLRYLPTGHGTAETITIEVYTFA